MNRPSESNSESSATQQPMAVELANLRHHFSPISTSSFGTRVVPGIDSASNGDTLVDRRSPLPLDNEFVQQTKDQIRSIVETIASLANSPIAPDDFVHAVLPKVANAMGAEAAALWQQLPDSQWRLIGNFKLPQSLIDSAVAKDTQASELSGFEKLDFLEERLASVTQRNDSCAVPEALANEDAIDWLEPSASHALILNAVARERQPILIPPCDAMLNRDRPANPTQALLIYAPLPIPHELGHYWLQVVQSPSGGPSSHRGYLRFVSQMADLMSDYFRSHRLRVFERDREYLAIAEHTMHELAGNLNPKLGVARLMKTIREHARSEHAFLLAKESYYGRWRVVGAAGLVEIDRRASGVGQIERASSSLHTMFRDGGSLTHSQLPDHVEDRDLDLAQLFNTFAVSELQWIKPLSGTVQSRRSNKLDCAILLTWSGMDKPPERSMEQSALIAKLGLSAMQIGWWKRALLANRNSKSSLASMANPGSWPRVAKWAMGIILLSLVAFVPVPIHLNATAIMVPQVQQHVYAPVDATVDEVFIEHGQRVRKGDLLLRLKSISLSLDSERALSELNSKRERLEVLKARLLTETSLSQLQQDQLAMESREIQSGLAHDERRIQLLQRQVDSLLIRASVDGIISTWNLQDNLRDRPLKTGQWLLSIQESESPWIMEASLPERDAQEFREAIDNQHGQSMATMTSMPQVQLPVQLSRTTPPRIEYAQHGLSENDPLSASLRIRFDVDTSSLSRDAAIAGTTARISIPVGRGPLIWALGKDFAYQVWSRVQLWI